jgi:ankyrin repeat protein
VKRIVAALGVLLSVTLAAGLPVAGGAEDDMRPNAGDTEPSTGAAPHAAPGESPEAAGASTGPATAPASGKKPPGVAALVRAAGESDVAKLNALLRQGAPVNAQATSGETPLQAAAAEGLTTNVFTLLTSGADIDMIAGRGITALGWAARGGHLPAVRTLLDSGADVDRAASPDRAPISLATAREHVAVVALLIERGSKVFGQPPLAGAVMMALSQTTSAELVGLIVPRIAPMIPKAPGLRDSTATAIAASSVPVAQAISTHLGDVAHTSDFQTAVLFAAVRRGRHDVASSAITAGAEVNARRGPATPIGIAVEQNDVGMVQLLLSANADWKMAGVDAARLEELAGSEITERREADRLAALGEIDRLDERGMTLLFRAAQRGNFLSVKQLLDKGANPATTVERWPGDSGWTPLMTAAAGNQIAIVKLLLAQGAPVDQRNAAGRTALSFAAFYGRAGVVDMLLSAGADPLAADSAGQTPLLLAIASGDSPSMMRLNTAVRTAEADRAAARAATAPAAEAR